MSNRGREVFRSTKVAWARGNPFWHALGAWPSFVGILAVVAALVTGETSIVVKSLFFALLCVLAAWNAKRSAKLAFGELTAGKEGVHLDGRLLASKDSIRQGLVVPRPGAPPLVRLVRRGWRLPVELVATDENEGRRLLHALGLDASQMVATFRGSSPLVADRSGRYVLATTMLVVFGLAFGLRLVGAPSLGWRESPLFLLSVAMSLVFIVMAPTRIEVGSDGFMTRWLWRRRFVPWSNVERIGSHRMTWMNRPYSGVEIVLADGEQVLLPVGSGDSGESATAMLLERMREAMTPSEVDRSENDAAVLSRRGREPRAWLDALRAIGAGANADHRRAAVPSDRLWRIAEDVTESAITRASAAVALGPSLRDERDRERLRTAADATASPKLRIVLQSAASRDSDDEVLAENLAELEAGEAADRLRAS